MRKMSKLFAWAFVLSLILLAGCSTYEVGYDQSFDFLTYGEADLYGEKYEDYEENPFISVSEFPVSTFSIDADGASYSNMRRFLNLGQLPPKASVRIEEYINYFTFDYPEPANGERVSVHSELSTCPWNTNHHLLRIGLKGKSIPDSELKPSNYVFLIDVSGSMDSADKLGVLKSGFKLFAENLKPEDKVAITVYAGNASIALYSTSGKEKDKIIKAIDKLSAGGSTAGSAGIEMAYEIAQENFIENGNNRVILGTDGDFNIGRTSTEDMIELIEEKRKSGIYLTVLGVGGGNLNDNMMEQIANKGNGNYEYIDNARQIEKVFVHEKSKFYAVANDCKNQLTFNPGLVHRYRLIGYENRSLNDEDFEDDEVDAGELGSSQTITAIYELELVEGGTGKEYAKFDFRYKEPGNTQSRLITHSITNQPVSIDKASENMRFAAAVTGLGLYMKQSEYKGNLNKQMIIDLAKSALTFDPHGYRKEFLELTEAMKSQ